MVSCKFPLNQPNDRGRNQLRPAAGHVFERRPCREKHRSMLQLTAQVAVDEQQLATFLREVVPVMEQDFKFDQLPAI